MAELSPEERRRIYEEEKARKDAQDTLKQEEQQKATQKTKKGCLGCLGLVGLLFIVFYFFWPTSTTPPRDFVNRGEQGQLINGFPAVRVAVDGAALDAADSAIAAKDNLGLQLLFTQGRVFMAPSSTKVLVLDPGILSTTVRILDGPHAGKSGIVPAEWIKKP